MSGTEHPESRFAERLIRWYDSHGRKSLPWQGDRDAYAIWISEIMLQQTQVATVIPYYQKFMARFPSVQCLADAPRDEVLHHWSGLGYYARARNLHRAAQQVRDQHDGRFPLAFDEVLALPGIGRSTAGSILAFADAQRHPILDGNVKRVLTRVFAIDGFPGHRATQKRLWEVADRLTPEKRVASYNQAIMDLGASLCSRRNPSCSACPWQSDCMAQRQGNPHDYPGRRPTRQRPLRHTTMLLITTAGGEVLLTRRPPRGIWGGLWSLPEFSGAPDDLISWSERELGLSIAPEAALPHLRHGFSHYDLTITPQPARMLDTTRVMDSEEYLWYNPESPAQVGLPAPVERLLAGHLRQDTPDPSHEP